MLSPPVLEKNDSSSTITNIEQLCSVASKQTLKVALVVNETFDFPHTQIHIQKKKKTPEKSSRKML